MKNLFKVNDPVSVNDPSISKFPFYGNIIDIIENDEPYYIIEDQDGDVFTTTFECLSQDK